MDSPQSVNSGNDYANLPCESLNDPTKDWPELLIPPITIYTSSPPLLTDTHVPDSDTSSLVLQFQSTEYQPQSPEAPLVESGGAQSGSADATQTANVCTTYSTYSNGAHHTALDLLATVATARDDKP
ncbi:hypothetical protein M404DRAFT_27203 [Pisolithus tinctorius Marx 270]|uniref:Uncharacterized protein n=1 Tax=Pisolithus tinctorius Marx 270 TaxID=870435 RepID=A0A0C3P6K5_PISTI|nr:hypothetical protein M404DRAFT_27203 [Pisolithus tinctorius Marx 270]